MSPLTELQQWLQQVHLTNDYPLLPDLHCRRYTPQTNTTWISGFHRGLL